MEEDRSGTDRGIEKDDSKVKEMNLNVLAVLAYVLSDNVIASSKHDAACLQDCTCGISKDGRSAIRQIDCRNANYRRMPNTPVNAQNREKSFSAIRLILSENRIDHLDVVFLNQWKSLEVLILSKNKLKSLSKSTEDVSSMPSLKSLDLSSNSLQVLHTFVLVGFPSLRILNISHNQIHTISEGAFLLPSLHELDLSHNQMTEAAPHLFDSSPQLHIIRFSHNRVSRLLGNSLS